ncbi:unnamed protein product [Notodromas monacha]|uniref:Annexin n=1 Tax=Notodromas monacha TaxID=399045 RepID=A0A7R9BHS0_9CRUS|nr:unnamed protein product [Notodromas monacha]CAG0914686.1 unnamed protein product [Notodromas monacha]
MGQLLSTRAGTVVEMPGWDVEGAAEKIYKACKGLGTTEADITEVVCSISNAQRQTLREKYLAMYGEDLMDRLKSELKSRYQDVIIGLMTPPDEYLADWLQWAMKGAGTEEDTLIEILCCRTNEELERVKNAYKAKCERDLEEDIESELTGEFQRLVRAVLACGRDESGTVDKDLAKSDAQELLDAGANQWGTDESKFNAILCTRSYPHLRQVFRYYNEISGTDITEAIDAEFTGHAQAGMLAIVFSMQKKKNKMLVLNVGSNEDLPWKRVGSKF